MTNAMHTVLTGLSFPEGPAFAPDGSLWAVELKGGCLIQYRDGTVLRHEVGGAPNGIAVADDGSIWFCDAGQNAVCQFDPVTRQSTTIASRVGDGPLTKPNDLAFDALGNLVFTCPGESRRTPDGYVCVRTPDGSIRPIATGLYFPNGLAFAAGGAQLVIAETYRHRLWKGDWNPETAEWTNARVWCAIGGPDGPGGPDGMAFDREGNLFVAVYGTGEVRIVDPAGRVIDRIFLPGRNPTNCAFDPAGHLGLVITEAEKGQLLSFPMAREDLPLWYGPTGVHTARLSTATHS